MRRRVQVKSKHIELLEPRLNLAGLSFEVERLVETDHVFRSPVPIDMDGDGDRDVVWIARKDSRIGWIRNQDTQFSDGFRLATNYEPFDFAVGDFDRNETTDMAVVSNDGIFEWFSNDGSGELASVRRRNVAGNALAVVVADMDGDSDLDFVVGLRNRIEWLENRGPDLELVPHLVASDHGADDLQVADVDRNGAVDVFFQEGDRIGWYAQDLSQQFEPQDEVVRASSNLSRIHLQDLDDDGDLDVVAAGTSGPLEWYAYDNGQFRRNEIEANSIGRDIAFKDFDLDGDLDIVWANGSLSYLHTNFGDGQFGERIEFELGSPTLGHFVFADLTGNGRDDLLGNSLSRIAFLERISEVDPGLQFTSPRYLSPTFQNPSGVLAVDLDGDNDLDVLSTASEQRVSWFENEGDGKLSQEILIVSGIQASVADVDTDGQLDIVTYERTTGIGWHRGQQGTYEQRRVAIDTRLFQRRSVRRLGSGCRR